MDNILEINIEQGERMDREEEVLEIFSRNISAKDKIHLLEDLELDLNNEMEAQQENMQPEIQNRLSQALMLVSNLLRELRDLK